jgi:hypothetical protein
VTSRKESIVIQTRAVAVWQSRLLHPWGQRHDRAGVSQQRGWHYVFYTRRGDGQQVTLMVAVDWRCLCGLLFRCHKAELW